MDVSDIIFQCHFHYSSLFIYVFQVRRVLVSLQGDVTSHKSAYLSATAKDVLYTLFTFEPNMSSFVITITVFTFPLMCLLYFNPFNIPRAV